MALRHRKRRIDLDEKIQPPDVDDPEEALARILAGNGARPEDYEPEDVPED